MHKLIHQARNVCTILTFVFLVPYFSSRSVAEEAVEFRHVEGYPMAASKKGLQVQDVADALALGIKHAALNVNLCQLVDVNAPEESNQPSWEIDGRKFYFQVEYLNQLDRSIRELSDHGVLVNLIILAYDTTDARTTQIMLHPQYDPDAPMTLGMFNTATPEGRAWLAAAMEFIAARWSRADQKFGRVVGYIVGNEVNSHWWWCNMGRVSIREFTRVYLDAVQLFHMAVRQQSSWARVYVSLEHHWSIRYPPADELQAFPARAFIDLFSALARDRGDFDWHVAFHPYPENLFEPRFWNDKTALPTEDTPRITFKNLEVLPLYLQRAALRYGGQPRRVILSEQGFHTPNGPDGETIQAAAFCAAYKKAERLEGIDAFILHRHIDHPHEGGLLLGLRAMEPDGGELWRKKKIYTCFKLADTTEWEQAFEFALPIVGITQW